MTAAADQDRTCLLDQPEPETPRPSPSRPSPSRPKATRPDPPGRDPGGPQRSLRHVFDRLAAGATGPPAVREPILASWRRAAESGLVPDHIHAPYDPDIDAGGRLRWAAAPALAAVSADLADLDVALLLSDSRAHLIERWAPPATARAMDRIGAAAGFVCAESLVGTNSIGAALGSRGPAVVLGFEHFADALTGVSCAARAVTDPLTGQLLGAVNLTCPPSTYSPVMPALIARIAHETEQRLLGDSEATATALYAAFLRARRRARGPVAVLDGRHMFVNTAGATVVDSADRAPLWDWARRRLGTPAGLVPAPVLLASGLHPARCAPVRDGDRVVGAVIWLDAAAPDAQPRVLSPEPAGRWLSLTTSERSLSELVANGLTNRELAAELFISTHTVDYHLRQIFRKLGVRSRVELARLVADAGRVTRHQP
jgi:DNA-binding CsgD family transcriptional regulator